MDNSLTSLKTHRWLCITRLKNILSALLGQTIRGRFFRHDTDAVMAHCCCRCDRGCVLPSYLSKHPKLLGRNAVTLEVWWTVDIKKTGIMYIVLALVNALIPVFWRICHYDAFQLALANRTVTLGYTSGDSLRNQVLYSSRRYMIFNSLWLCHLWLV